MIQIPQLGLELIKTFEGCHLNAYPDPKTKGPPITIGWGSTRDFDGQPFKLGRTITQKYADDLLEFQLKNSFLPVLQKIPYWDEMNNNQKGALLSFAYNLGAHFYGSKGFATITNELKNKNWSKVPDILLLYRNPGSNVEEGLRRRRIAEGNLWKKLIEENKMKIDLQNFFRYYNHQLPNHRAAVDDLVRVLELKAPELLEDSANWVKIYRSPSAPPKPSGILLNVPWYPQTDNYALPDSTCNSSACAMCLEFLKPGSLPPGPKGDDAYLRKVLALGKSTDHTVQTRVLQSYGVNSVFRQNLSFADLDRELQRGRPVVLGMLHRGPESAPVGTGHMIVAIGKTESGDYVVHDPYGNLYDGYTSSVHNGKQVVYRKSTLERRWTVKHPKDGWGRIFT